MSCVRRVAASDHSRRSPAKRMNSSCHWRSDSPSQFHPSPLMSARETAIPIGPCFTAKPITASSVGLSPSCSAAASRTRGRSRTGYWVRSPGHATSHGPASERSFERAPTTLRPSRHSKPRCGRHHAPTAIPSSAATEMRVASIRRIVRRIRSLSQTVLWDTQATATGSGGLEGNQRCRSD